MSVLDALGSGQQKGYTTMYRGTLSEVNLLRKVRLEIAVNDDFEEKTVDAILEGAYQGQMGDGMIFILDLPKLVRIRTKERTGQALR